MILSIAALVVGTIALILAFVALIRAGDTQKQVKRLRNAVSDLDGALPGKFDQLAKDLGARLAQQIQPPAPPVHPPRDPAPPPPAQEQAPVHEDPAEEVIINFDCPACGQNIDAPDTMVGMNVACPTCSKIISVPAQSGARSTLQEVANEVAEAPEEAGGGGVTSPDEELSSEALKGATVRIDVGQLFEEMEPPKRQIIIKRRAPGE